MVDPKSAKTVAGSSRSAAVYRRFGHNAGQAAIHLVALLPCLAVPVSAAVPDRGLNLQVPSTSSPLAPPPVPGAPTTPRRYQPAPLPNRNVELVAPRASTEPHVAPNLFTRQDQYRGDGFNKGSTVQSEEEKRLKPGAGFSLHMPLTPN